MLLSGERQVAPSLDGIRRDHVARYEWAGRTLPPGSRVIDVACGVGYGAAILARSGHTVVAIDNDAEAIAYANEHYAHPNITFRCADADDVAGYLDNSFDAATCFETIEHLADPQPMLRALRDVAPLLLASVPNEAVFPFRGYEFHHRHYTRAQFASILRICGYQITGWCGQRDEMSEVDADLDGRTIIVTACQGPRLEVVQSEPREVPEESIPAHVVILGLGPSLEAYVDLVKRQGARKVLSDEVWGINAVGDVIQCDRLFHMDDVLIQEIRAKAKPESNIAAMLPWLRKHPGPVYTSIVRDGYPGLVAFPLEDVINNLGYGYFNSTAAYAVAYAIHIGVKKISLFGFDFTYPNAHKAEKGRGCVEYWLGFARARGIEIGLPGTTSLLDGLEPEDQRLYGYDAVQVGIEVDGDDWAKVTMLPRETLPTAEEIERRYDHSAHPNPLVQAQLRK